MRKIVLEAASLKRKHRNGCHDCGTPYVVEVSGTWHSGAKTKYPFGLLIVSRLHCLCTHLKLLNVFSVSGLVAGSQMDRFIALLCQQLLCTVL